MDIADPDDNAAKDADNAMVDDDVPAPPATPTQRLIDLANIALLGVYQPTAPAKADVMSTVRPAAASTTAPKPNKPPRIDAKATKKGDKTRPESWADEVDLAKSTNYDSTSILETKIMLEEAEKLMQQSSKIEGDRDFLLTVKTNRALLQGIADDLKVLRPNIPDSLIREVVAMRTDLRRALSTQDELIESCANAEKTTASTTSG